MTLRIDSHHHFWRYAPAEYSWIGDKMQTLRRDFLPADLKKELRASGIDGAVSVQARQTIEETSWLLSLAEKSSFLFGVVGWLPIAADDFPAHLDRFRSHAKLKGMRHIVQDEPDDNYILRPDFNRGITHLESTGLVYDILIFERHLPQAIQFVDRHPAQVFVIDHLAKPRIASGVIEPWRRNLCELAKRNHVYCKLSGIVTEANWERWSLDSLRPYFDVVLESFGPGRLMMGSDWPVCLLASSYAGWQQTVDSLISELSANEQAQIMGGNAAGVYRLQAATGPSPI